MIVNTKKITALILCLTFLISLTGCGRKTSHYSAYVKSLITGIIWDRQVSMSS